ncbi:MAG: hypothetical protein DRI39_04360 [Chloroflexi bacterium]|nr:MAG: hypothetical protein DRI39_04360 [Chloroflexota bacterium]RLC97331.1 MAG: hypothetical protein DRI40_00535 [Chloroflexota bacterium]
MDAALRAIAVFLEVLVLTGIIYCVLNGVRLAALDFGIAQRFSRPIVLFLAAVGSLLVVFFASHLSIFYPSY